MCSTCGKGFNRECHLNDHMEVVHNLLEKRKCIKCESTHRQKKNFIVHYKKKHMQNCENEYCTARNLCYVCSKFIEIAKQKWLKKKRSKFKVIKANKYSCTVKQSKKDVMQCDCRVNCDFHCLNRNMFIECNIRTCIFGRDCKNMQIQKKKLAAIEIFNAGKKGIGLKSKGFISRGTYIGEYVGEVKSFEDFMKSMRTDYSNEEHHYCMHFENGFVIDAYRMGNVIRYANHSCNPNCQIQKWLVNGASRLALYAIEDINANEELTYDYKFMRFEAVQSCFCGSPNCCGSL